MSLTKNILNIPLVLGLQQKTDPWQLASGQFLELSNIVFTTDKRLTKRNGYPLLTTLPDGNGVNTLITFQGSLVGLGSDLFSFNGNQWVDKGRMQPIDLSVLPATRSSYNQTSPDASYSDNGLVCVVWEEQSLGHYCILDSTTGEVVVRSTILPNSARCPRTFMLGNFFVITFLADITGTPHLQYIAIPKTSVLSPHAAVDISTQVSSAIVGAYDGFISPNDGRLYLVWNGSDLGGALRFCFIDSVLAQHVTFTQAGFNADLVTIFTDQSTSTTYVWIVWYDTSTTSTRAACYTANLSSSTVAPTLLSSSLAINALTILSTSGILTAYLQVNNVYSYGTTRTDYIASFVCNQAAVVTGPVTIARGVGLAGKAFYNESLAYLLVAYGSPTDPNSGYEPSYFLITNAGNVVSRVAATNAGGYATSQVLSNVTLIDGTAKQGYLVKDLLASLNKGLPNAPGSSQAGIYTQTGVNLASFNLAPQQLITTEIGGNLNASGGLLWQYDGTRPVENNFNVFPEDINTTWSDTGGSMAAQPDASTNTDAYFYQVTYEYTDNAGNLSRSAPSVPVSVTTTGSGTTGSVTLVIPTLRLTYKNMVRIVIYRWSVANQNYYQVTSISAPLANDPTIDDVTYVDTLADASIIGNNLVYTTGGVIENIAPPASPIEVLFKNRLWVLDAEDRNLWWYSKQVIENTPVEMSDLFTYYIAPSSIGFDTGPITAAAAMDDKLISFKSNSIFYTTGTGPDNTGANNDFQEPVFVTSAVGCTNQRSIVLTPTGLMFQSSQGIWLLGRDLQVSYIGSPVEGFNSFEVVAAVAIPRTTQVRFSLSNGVKLMYDYFYGKWGTFNGASSISATIYGGNETILTSFSQVWQETPNSYVDGASPVTMKFTTGWLNLAGLQGFERAYFMYLIGEYKSPHTLSIQIAYDYNSSKFDSYTISPDNFGTPWGGDYAWGQGSPWGGPEVLEQWRVFFKQQKCQALQITLQEAYDPSFGVNPGAGLTLSGIDFVVGAKSTYPRLKASRQVG